MVLNQRILQGYLAVLGANIKQPCVELFRKAVRLSLVVHHETSDRKGNETTAQDQNEVRDVGFGVVWHVRRGRGGRPDVLIQARARGALQPNEARKVHAFVRKRTVKPIPGQRRFRAAPQLDRRVLRRRARLVAVVLPVIRRTVGGALGAVLAREAAAVRFGGRKAGALWNVLRRTADVRVRALEHNARVLGVHRHLAVCGGGLAPCEVGLPRLGIRVRPALWRVARVRCARRILVRLPREELDAQRGIRVLGGEVALELDHHVEIRLGRASKVGECVAAARAREKLSVYDLLVCKNDGVVRAGHGLYGSVALLLAWAAVDRRAYRAVRSPPSVRAVAMRAAGGVGSIFVLVVQSASVLARGLPNADRVGARLGWIALSIRIGRQ